MNSKKNNKYIDNTEIDESIANTAIVKKVKKKKDTSCTENENVKIKGKKRKLSEDENQSPKKHKKSQKEIIESLTSQDTTQNNSKDYHNEVDKISMKKKKKHKQDGNYSELNPKDIQNSLNNNIPVVKHELNIIDIDNAAVTEGIENVVTISIKDIGHDSEWDANDLLKQLEKKVDEPKEDMKVRKSIPKWPEEDLNELINRVDASIPENDCLNYTKRVEVLEWDKIAFKNYTVDDCKKTWSYVLNKVRKYRYLREVLEDVKQWVANPKPKSGKAQRHPDQPRRPLSAFFIYYIQEKDKLQAEHPGMDATELAKLCSQDFKQLPPEEKEIYEKMAADNRKEYDKKLKQFYEEHPEELKVRPEKPPKPLKTTKSEKEKSGKVPKSPKESKIAKEKPLPKEKVPKRALPPFQYFCISETEKENVEDKGAFREVCKEKWKQMPDNQKIEWINYAESENYKYEEEMKKYTKNHPEYVVQKISLSKENQLVKERLAGKPTKPPSSPYNIFVGRLLQSEEIKDVPSRDRLTFVSDQWKACSEEEKKEYKNLYDKLTEKYKLDYAAYLESLPEEERQLELQKSAPKRRKSDETKKEVKSKKTKQASDSNLTATDKKMTEKKSKKMVEPEQPPISPYKYFLSVYQGEEPGKAWKSLTSAQKKTYEEELVKKKKAYIVAFEKFLKSMSKEELEAFSNARRKVKQDPLDDEDMDSSGESDSDNSDDSEESED